MKLRTTPEDLIAHDPQRDRWIALPGEADRADERFLTDRLRRPWAMQPGRTATAATAPA